MPLPPKSLCFFFSFFCLDCRALCLDKIVDYISRDSLIRS
jgi:hypothetical protein